MKTSEAEAGVRDFLRHAPPAALSGYRAALAKVNGGDLDPLRYYPGSPLFFAQSLRPGDRYIGAELHPEDFSALRRNLDKAPEIQLHHRDGYEMLTALTPPPERRGLALLDPPYEQPDDYQRLANAVQAVQTRWPGAVLALWYPLKDLPTPARFHEALVMTGVRKQLRLEFSYAAPQTGTLHGSGMIVVQPPWRFDEAMRENFALLSAAWPGAPVKWQIAWLTGE